MLFLMKGIPMSPLRAALPTQQELTHVPWSARRARKQSEMHFKT